MFETAVLKKHGGLYPERRNGVPTKLEHFWEDSKGAYDTSCFGCLPAKKLGRTSAQSAKRRLRGLYTEENCALFVHRFLGIVLCCL